MDPLVTVVAAAQAGDLESYGKLVARFQDMAFGYAYAILGDFHLAEDAAQASFRRALELEPTLVAARMPRRQSCHGLVSGR